MFYAHGTKQERMQQVVINNQINRDQSNSNQ